MKADLWSNDGHEILFDMDDGEVTKSDTTEYDFEAELWNNGKHAMLFDLDDDAVISIIKHCIDKREIDRNCTIETLKDNLIPINQIKSYLEYITRYDDKVIKECFNSLMTITEQHKKMFAECAKMYAAEKFKITGSETITGIVNRSRRYGILKYMLEFNECMDYILSKENESE